MFDLLLKAELLFDRLDQPLAEFLVVHEQHLLAAVEINAQM
jgi:hypothetical protein